MRLTAMICAASLLPCAAVSQDAWGDAAGCARVAGEPPQSDMLFVLWPDRIERWEANCRITGFDGDLNTRGVIETECSGEGETWSQLYGITPLGDGAYAIWPAAAPDFITELRRCP